MDGQWWRLVAAMFVHIGLMHLLINMWCLYELGLISDEIYGGARTLLMYRLTAVPGAYSLWQEIRPSSLPGFRCNLWISRQPYRDTLVGKLPLPSESPP